MIKNNLIHNLTDHNNLTNQFNEYPSHNPRLTLFDVKGTIKYLTVYLNP